MIETPYDDFQREDYLDINKRRFDHLDILNIDFSDKTILEVGAGIGDHTDNLLKYNPKFLYVTDVRDENILILREKFKANKIVSVGHLDMDNPDKLDNTYDICYCYGLLYHLSRPENAIQFLSEYTKDILLLETCVDYLNVNTVNNTQEPQDVYSQSYHGQGCRPGRIWLYAIMKKYFEYVYVPLVQPDHYQFPINWTMNSRPSRLTRSIFVASRRKISNCLLTEDIPHFQINNINKINNVNLIALKIRNRSYNLFTKLF